MWDMTDDERERALIDWGVPTELLSFTYFNPDEAQPMPSVRLPDEWTPQTGPSIEVLAEAMDAEVGIWLPAEPIEPIDLAWFGDAIARTTGLGLPIHNGSVNSLDRLVVAENIRWLRGPSGDTVVDLSHLQRLERVDLLGLGLASSLVSPSLTHVSLDLKEALSDSVAINPRVTSLAVTAPVIDVRSIARRLTELRYFGAFDSPLVDVSELGRLEHLERIKILSCREVRGISGLQRSRSLKNLVLYSVRVLDDPRSLLLVPADRVEATGCADIDEELARDAKRLRPGWYIKAARRKKGRSRFEVASVADVGTCITFTDWSWLKDLADDTEFGPFALEDLLRAVAEDDLKTRDVPVQYDSEGDAFNAIVRTTQHARLLVRVWDEFLSQTDRLLQVLTESPRQVD